RRRWAHRVPRGAFWALAAPRGRWGESRARRSRVRNSLAGRLLDYGIFREYHEEGDDLEVVDPLELALHGMGAAGGEEAGDGPLLLLADDRGDRRGKQVLGRTHVFTVPGGLVKAVTGPGVGQVAPNREPLQAVKQLLDLGERQQD